jgi:uncharacterized membrane protein HdeD (DUF308 family)
MLDALARNWWAIVLRGVAALVFGIVALFVPVAAFWAFVMLFAAFALVNGALAIVASVWAAQAHERWGQLLVSGIFGVSIAIITWFYPALAALTLLYVIAAWAIVTGVLELVAAFELRKHLEGEFWWMLAGIISIFFGILLVWRPLAGAVALVWWVAIYALVVGAALIGLGFRLRERLHAGSAHPA